MWEDQSEVVEGGEGMRFECVGALDELMWIVGTSLHSIQSLRQEEAGICEAINAKIKIKTNESEGRTGT